MAFRYSGTGWRVAASIRIFGDQIMTLRGHTRSYTVDGTLGDTEHSNRVSDHNPDHNGIVRALDFYEHEAGIVDQVAEAIRVAQDPRCKYFIHDDRMFSSYISPTGIPAWRWRPYGGINGHENHGHLSVVSDPIAEQTQPWPMPGNRMEDDMWQYLNIDESLVRHASEQGWYKLPDGRPDRSQKTLNYWLANLTKLQEAVAPAGFDVDWLAWRRAVTNGIARGGAQGPPGADGADGADGVSEAKVKEIIAATRLSP